MPDVMCPHCKNPVYDEDALLCHFCGQSLGRVSRGLLGAMRGAGMKWAGVTIALVLILGTILVMMR
jgi:hypothetical protein